MTYREILTKNQVYSSKTFHRAKSCETSPQIKKQNIASYPGSPLHTPLPITTAPNNSVTASLT